MNKVIKMTLDIIMTVLFLLLMKISFTGIALHEVVGIGIFFLFIIHKLLNYKFVFAVFKGKGNAKAKGMLWFDFVLFLFVGYTVISGILISQTILTNIEASNISLWSNLHHFAAYSSLILLSVHIGLHWKMVMGFFKKIMGFKEEKPFRTLVSRIMVAVIAFIGVRALTNPNILMYFTAPFSNQQTTGTVLTQTSSAKKDDDDTKTISLSTNGQVANTPTLQDYLSNLFCSGCSKHCPLLALQCNRGTQYENAAVAEYNATYSQSASEESSESESAGAESSSTTSGSTEESSQSTIPDNSTESSDITDDYNNLTSDSSSDISDRDISVLDFVGIMGIVVAGTYYIVTIPKKI